MRTQIERPIESSSSPTVGADFYSLLDAVDSESIANDFEIGTYTAKHDFDNHLKVAIFEGVHPSDSLDELAEKTDTHDQVAYMAGSTFSRLTNDRDYRAVVRLFFELLHSPQLYHQCGVQRKRLDWLERAVVATDATNLPLTRSIEIPSESHDTEILRTSWDGEAFQGLEIPLNTVATQLNTLTANHKAYPILHYFYSEDPAQAPTTSITVLDEALTMLRFGVAEENCPNEILIKEVRSSVQSYLETVGSAYIEPADQSPPLPEMAALRDAGVPTVSDQEFIASITDLSERRRTLLGLVESDERRWPSPEQS